MKEKNVDPELRGGKAGVGDVWTWTAIDADTKLIPSFHVGGRNKHHAKIFVDDLASRLANRVQLTTDGNKALPVSGRECFRLERGGLRHAGQDLRQVAGRRAPLQSCGLYYLREAPDHGRPGPEAHLNIPRRAEQPYHAYGDASVYAADQRLLQEDREPPPRRGPSLHALQLLPDSPDPTGDPGHGRRRGRPLLVRPGDSRDGRPIYPQFKLTHYRRSPRLDSRDERRSLFVMTMRLYAYSYYYAIPPTGRERRRTRY